MPWEFTLMAEGYDEAQRARRRVEAGWLAFLLSAQCGKPVTAAQLLGEAPAETSEARKQTEGEKRIAEIRRKLKRAAKKKGT